MLPRSAFCLFCDDARQEVGNKTSYMGVYPTDIVFPPSPPPETQIVLPKLVVAAWLITDIADKPEHLTITVSAPGNPELLKMQVSSDQLAAVSAAAPGWAQRHLVHAVFPFLNLPLPHEGFFTVVFETERETIQAGRLRVVIPDRPDPGAVPQDPILSSPTASPPPSEQSLSDVPATKRQPVRRRPSSRRSARTPGQE